MSLSPWMFIWLPVYYWPCDYPGVCIVAAVTRRWCPTRSDTATRRTLRASTRNICDFTTTSLSVWRPSVRWARNSNRLLNIRRTMRFILVAWLPFCMLSVLIYCTLLATVVPVYVTDLYNLWNLTNFWYPRKPVGIIGALRKGHHHYCQSFYGILPDNPGFAGCPSVFFRHLLLCRTTAYKWHRLCAPCQTQHCAAHPKGSVSGPVTFLTPSQ